MMKMIENDLSNGRCRALFALVTRICRDKEEKPSPASSSEFRRFSFPRQAAPPDAKSRALAPFVSLRVSFATSSCARPLSCALCPALPAELFENFLMRDFSSQTVTYCTSSIFVSRALQFILFLVAVAAFNTRIRLASCSTPPLSPNTSCEANARVPLAKRPQPLATDSFIPRGLLQRDAASCTQPR